MSKDFLYPLRRLHGKLYDAKMLRKKYKELCNHDSNTVFLVMTPEHGNIGDHAIAASEAALLKKLGVSFVELSGKDCRQMADTHILHYLNGHKILINGGGNLGTLWMDAELLQRKIIQANSKSTIVFLPNTIYYEDSDWGKKEFNKSKKIYNHHKNLYLFAREKYSYEIMKQAYLNVKLIPDMVLSMPPYEKNYERNGCILCLRSDLEKTRTEDQEKEVYHQAELLFGDNIHVTDMVINRYISRDEREQIINAKLDEFSKARLVITDRLHAMIFCALSGTPCIVINSRSHKVKGCYEWIEHLEYIKFADDIKDIASVYKQIPDKKYKYDNQKLASYFVELSRQIVCTDCN